MLALFSHVGIIVRDLDEAVGLWQGVLGLVEVERYLVHEEGVRCVLLATEGAPTETTKVELIQPLDAASGDHPVARRLRSHGEGIFHLAFRASDPEAVAHRLSDRGLKAAVLAPAGAEPHPRVVVSPSSTHGVLIEILRSLAPTQEPHGAWNTAAIP